jgi:hypothetical protein
MAAAPRKSNLGENLAQILESRAENVGYAMLLREWLTDA